MFHRYTLQPVGRGHKLLRHDLNGTTTAITTLTVDDRAARMLTQLLANEYAYGAVYLAADAARAGVEPANCRRRTLTAFDTATGTGSWPDPDADCWHAERFGGQAGSCVHGQPAAVVAAVREEVAALFAGTDTVLVTATVTSSEYKGGEEILVVNDWLDDDEEIAEAVAEALTDAGRISGSGAFRLVDLFDTDLADLDGNTFDHDVVLDVPSLRAWLAVNRPAWLT